MKNATMLTILVLALMLCLVGVSQAAPMGTAFTYQGRLMDGESWADGLYEFEFNLFDEASEGTQVDGTCARRGVEVSDGYFTVQVDFGSDAFDGDARWLEIGVRPEDTSNPFTTLSPRQEVTPSPYALQTRGIFVDNELNVGIGTTEPGATLDIIGDLATRNPGSTPNGSQILLSSPQGNPGLTIQLGDGAGDRLNQWVTGVHSDESYYIQERGALGTVGTKHMVIASGGYIGIGTESPSSGAALSVGRASAKPSIVASSDSDGGWLIMDSSGTGSAGVNYYTDGDVILAKGGGNVGVGTTTPTQKLHVAGTIRSSSGGFMFPDNSVQTTAATHWVSQGDSILNTNAANVGIGVAIPTSKLTVGGNIFVSTADGTIITPILQIIGGSDLSEQFDVRPDEKGVEPSAGMVVSIDPENPGELVVSSDRYDRKVAGIISGAGGIKPGMLMGQKGTVANGANPVALTGRVYCLADATNGSIQPGDLLTTSEMPGHAMKVTDYVRAQGAILGKAMTSLENGQGQVLVLVTLQ